MSDVRPWLGRVHPLPDLRRVAIISLHTSPLDQPGTGDAGGMNVYVLELSKRLAQRGVEVEIYTRATSSTLPSTVQAAPGVRVHHVMAGPFEGLDKTELPAQLCMFARELLRTEAGHERGHFDLIHSHYWLSGQVGALLRDRWSVPLVHTMHTMAKVKNAQLAEGDTPEPHARVLGEEQVVAAADMLLANTLAESEQLIDLYDAEPSRVQVVPPGVDLDLFRPRPQDEARRRLGLAVDAVVPTFVGRLQPLKAPDVLLNAVARLVAARPTLRDRVVVPVIGGPSGTGLEHPEALAELAEALGIADLVRFVPPVDRDTLVDWYAASTLVCVPSYNESFGLVAIEAQATGTPVVAAAVGGLPTVVRDGVTGILVDGHDPDEYAAAIARLVDDASLLERMRRCGARPRRRVRVGAHRRPDPRRLPQGRRGVVARPPQHPAGGRRWLTARRCWTSSAATLQRSDLEWEEAGEGQFMVELPGERKLKTPCRLDVGTHSFAIHAFVSRRVDENQERVYRWLLERNLKLYGVAFALDHHGDIYLDGRLPLGAVTEEELDKLLGSVLTYADESFNTILEMGFGSAIRKEWEWRTSRGESTANLEAFRGWLHSS